MFCEIAKHFLMDYFFIGPLSFNFDNAPGNITISLNPNSWTKMANIIFVDMPPGTGFSYATTKEASISSDSILAKQANKFIRKFLIDHPKFLKNPLYITGISYMGIVTPIVTLEVYKANERGDQPTLNIQVNYKTDLNFFELVNRDTFFAVPSPISSWILILELNMLIEWHLYLMIFIWQAAIENCHGNYVNNTNSLCINSLQRYTECTSGLNMEDILEPLCNKSDVKPYCREYYYDFAEDWINNKVVQQAFNIRQGTIGKWEFFNRTMHYVEGKNDTFCYAYNIFSSFSYHKKLVSKTCRALIFSGDHDMTFPYVGIEQWIVALNLKIESRWNPFYVNNQVGGYEVTYAQNEFSLTFATVKGAGHSVAQYKPKEAMALAKKWLALKTHSSAI
uniref:Uncharacterized protein n=1 Tax=Lactuca sativa TaxID=4236 RepID=A0A9R1VN66_LACSA|nr:hypothetical protein LSAT_V11C400169140 [Lactuca sativa]